MNPKPDPVSLTVHSVRPPGLIADESAPANDPAALRRTRMGRLKMLAVLLVCASPVVASYFTYYVLRPEGRNNYGTLITPTRAMPALTLRNLQGAPVAGTELKGQWLLITATSSQCDAACDRLLFMQRQLREMLGRERDRVERVWLVLDDGPIDPAVLQGVQSTAGANVFRASSTQVSAWLTPDIGQALQAHLYVVDPMGEWMMRMPANAEPAKVKRDIERLLRASSFWQRSGR